jgi:hypothetical protein
MNKRSTLGLALIAALGLQGCPIEEAKDADVDTACSSSQGELTTTNGRTLCVGLLANNADAPFMPGFKAPGRVQHSIAVFDADNEVGIDITTDADIYAIKHYPYMYMDNGHAHSTPKIHGVDTTAASEGKYDAIDYYLMPSSMNGTSQGRWEYRVMLKDKGADGIQGNDDDKTLKAVFHPDVKMVMGGNEFAAKAHLANDKMAGMDGMTPLRMYAVWLESVDNNGDDSHTVEIYLSTKDKKPTMAMKAMEHQHGNMNMSAHGDTDMAHYPALANGISLKNETDTEVSIDAVTINAGIADAQGNVANYITFTAGETDGFYTADFSDLSTETATTLVFDVSIQRTVDGATTTSSLFKRGSSAESPVSPQLVFTAP